MRLLTHNDHHLLTEYQNLTEHHVGVKFPLEYLKRSRVRVLVMDGKIRGGYTIVTEGPLRVIESLPQTISDVLKKHEICEVTGLWICPSLRGSLKSTPFWLFFCYELLVSRKDRCIYAYPLSVPALTKFYSHGSPTVLYRGLTNVQPGMKGPELESVEMASTLKVGLLPLISPYWFFRRLFLKKKKSV